MDQRMIEALEKISDTIAVVSGNLLFPSYHGLVKYEHVNKKIKEMKDVVKKLREEN